MPLRIALPAQPRLLWRVGGRRAKKGRAPLWLWPGVSSPSALAAGVLATRVPLAGWLGWLQWPGGPDSAVALLQTISGSAITVTALTFTRTVALQLASQ